MFILFYILFWFLYLLSGIILFVLNFLFFKKFSWIDISYNILQSQNKALWKIIKWQLIGQSIMISTIIYFMWVNFDKLFIDGVFHWNSLIQIFSHIFIYWFFWIIIFQSTIFIISKIIPLYKEIIIDENVSLWEIVSWILIWMSLIISISIFSY